MRLVILSQYFPPETGAPQNRLFELAKGFIKEGWDISVITAMPNYPKGKIFEEYRGKFSTKEIIDGITVYRYWIFASNSTKSLLRILSMISFSITAMFSLAAVKKIKPEYVLAESPPLTLSFTGYLLSLFSKAKLIMNVSDVWPLTAKELGYINDGFAYRCIEKLEKFLYKKSFLCTGQSEEIISHIKKYKKENTYLFRNGVDINRFRQPSVKNKQNNNFKIVYAGLLGVAQGIYSIVKNTDFKSLGAELHIYGDGPEKVETAELISSNGGGNVYLHNSVGRNQIPELLDMYDCALIPLVKNIYGAVPSKIYEAMAAGLPVLFSGEGEGAEIILQNDSGLVSNAGDFRKLEENILKLKTSEELRNKLSRNGRKAAEDKFDRNKLIPELSKKLKNMTGKQC
ncbi:MAG: hypothetical protein HGGPFJEG_01328 [Ignavibacteria bacterium]|nr:hypothetical protein [Ignavibacteria bacterium]